MSKIILTEQAAPDTPAADTVAIYAKADGILYKKADDGVESALGAPDLTNAKIASIGITIDGGGIAIATGLKGYIEVPYACTITRATLLADVSGSIVVDIYKAAYVSFPPVSSITASAKPTISAAQKSQDATLTGWTTSIAAGDILAFNVDSCSTITRATLVLKVTKT